MSDPQKRLMGSLSPAVNRRRPTARGRLATMLALLCVAASLVGVVAPQSARAETVPVPLGSTVDFAVLAAEAVTNTGASVVTGDVGVSPGSVITGFPPGQINGSVHVADGTAAQAQADLAIAYGNAAARAATAILPSALGGTTLTTGVYGSASGTFDLTGTLTLDAQGDPSAVFIFKTASTLITAASSAVNLINGAQSCNVFWQVGSSATLGSNSTLRGDVLAFTSITAETGTVVDGRTLAMNDVVTLDTATVTRSVCAEPRELSITAPEAAHLGGAPPGGTVSAHLGPVTVSDLRGVEEASWVATVVATDFVTTGSPVQTVPNANVSYWSGPATSTTGTGTFTSGQPAAGDAQTLDVTRTAYTHTGGRGTNSATWDPVVSVRLPLAAVAGLYTGMLTFSVA